MSVETGNLPPSKESAQDKLSNLEVEERAYASESLLNSKAFTDAMEDVYSRAVGTLLESEVGSLTASAAHATMKAIVDIRGQLEQYVTDHKMRLKYHKEGKKNG